MAVSSRTVRASAVACSIVGMACWWPFFRNSFLGMILYGESAVDDTSKLYFAAVVVLVIFSFAACSATKVLAFALSPISSAALIFSVLFLGCGIALKAFGTQGSCAMPVAFLGVTFVVLSAGCLALFWFMAARRMPIDRALFVFVTSFFLSFCIPYIAHFYGEMAMWWTNVASLIVSAICAIATRILLSNVEWDCGDDFNRVYDMDLREMATVIVFFLIAGSVFRGVFSQGVLDYSPGAETEFRYIEALVFSAAVMAVSFLFVSHRSFFTIAWMVFALMFLVGLLVLSALDAPGIEAGVSTVITARTFLAFLLWSVLAQGTRGRNDVSALRAPILFVFVEAIALLLTGITTPLVSGLSWVEENGKSLSLLMAIILVVGSFIYLGRLVVVRPLAQRSFQEKSCPDGASGIGSDALPRRRKDASSVSDPNDSSRQELAMGAFALERGAQVGEAARRAACYRIARRFGLTERESDVLFAISQGHSVKKTAEMLFISTGTVQSHVKRLYRKTGCHSRQDVIDLVDGEMQGE